MLWNLSWPAVSQTCNWIFLPLYSMVLILKSTPIVVMKLGSNSSPANLFRMQVLPTEELPINKTRKMWSVLLLPFCVDIFGKIENSYRRKFPLICRIWHLNACSNVSHKITLGQMYNFCHKKKWFLTFLNKNWKTNNLNFCAKNRKLKSMKNYNFHVKILNFWIKISNN